MLYPGPQTLRAVQRRGMAHHLPFALLIGESIADLDVMDKIERRGAA
jgi:hypothetical protein